VHETGQKAGFFTLIIGVGTDICDARRIAAALKKFNDRFRARIFTEAEVALAGSRSDESLFFAKRFAAKEAVYKALSTAPVAGFGWHDAEILSAAGGAPVLTLSGPCKRALEAVTPDGYKASVNLSLSDEPPYAVAFVVISAGPSNGPQELGGTGR